MSMTIVEGSIFDSKRDVIVNAVNCEGVMGKGIALEFKLRYPNMMENYEKACQNNQFKIGSLQLYKKSNPWILNFPTKDKWKYPSKVEYIETGLKKFVSSYKDRDINSIAFPMLGTSAGGLNEDIIIPLMDRYLGNIDIEVELYRFNPYTKDNFTKKFLSKVENFRIEDYKTIFHLTQKQAEVLFNTIDNDKLYSLSQLVNLDGIGKKTIEKIYTFVLQDNKTLFEIY